MIQPIFLSFPRYNDLLVENKRFRCLATPVSFEDLTRELAWDVHQKRRVYGRPHSEYYMILWSLVFGKYIPAYVTDRQTNGHAAFTIARSCSNIAQRDKKCRLMTQCECSDHRLAF